MKKLHILFAIMITAGVAGAQTWSVDKSHAKLGFGVTHLLLSEVEGSFTSFDSKITSSKEDFSDATIELTADVKSINTGITDRDTHLKSPDFFDAEKFPTLTFKSKSIKKAEGKKYIVTGDLTLHGVTKPVTLDVTLNGTGVHPYTKKTVAGFKITGTIKRADFTVGPTFGAATISEEVAIT
ncbi:MAG TPA: YceI family protein, partial [Cyclobacteriaceae bacterium]|nr:YceI family protein [Cyclobacteriaceae bacterium]